MGRELKLAENERLEHGERLRIKILHMFTGWINVFEQQIALVQHKRKGERSPFLWVTDVSLPEQPWHTRRTKSHANRRLSASPLYLKASLECHDELKRAVTVSPATSCTAWFGFSVYKKIFTTRARGDKRHVFHRETRIFLHAFFVPLLSASRSPNVASSWTARGGPSAVKTNENDPSLRLGKAFVHFGHSNTSKEHMNCMTDMNSIQHAREFWVRTRFRTKRPKTQPTRMPVTIDT